MIAAPVWGTIAPIRDTGGTITGMPDGDRNVFRPPLLYHLRTIMPVCRYSYAPTRLHNVYGRFATPPAACGMVAATPLCVES